MHEIDKLLPNSSIQALKQLYTMPPPQAGRILRVLLRIKKVWRKLDANRKVPKIRE